MADDLNIQITCPVCNTNFEKKAADLRDGAVIQCPKCNEKTTIKGTMFTDMVKNIDKGGHA